MVSDSTQLIPFFIITNFHWWEFLRLLMLLKIFFWSPPAPTIKNLKYLLLELLDYLLVKAIREYPSPLTRFQPILAAADT